MPALASRRSGPRSRSRGRAVPGATSLSSGHLSPFLVSHAAVTAPQRIHSRNCQCPPIRSWV